MENPTPFDLNEAIRRWQQDLSDSPAFKADNLEELAAHLRASVQRLKADGLSETEAFLIAARRIGQREPLEQEFAKVNPSAKWAMAAFWMVMGLFLQHIGEGVSSMTNLLLLNKFPWWDYPRVKWMAPATGYGYALILMFIILRMLAKRPQGGHQFVRRCLGHPFWTILSLVGIASLARIIPEIVTYNYYTATLSDVFIHSWREWLVLAESEILTVVFAIAIVVLARRGLRLNPSVRGNFYNRAMCSLR